VDVGKPGSAVTGSARHRVQAVMGIEIDNSPDTMHHRRSSKKE
jgi:hypothetical protein